MASSADDVETLQKTLARELQTDRAATSCAQTTRLPGFMNHKHERPVARIDRVSATGCRARAGGFSRPDARQASKGSSASHNAFSAAHSVGDRLERARRFLRSVEPAVAGQHGDLRTFRICCRLVRGFALSDDEAFSVLREWNARCEPPWSERDLQVKVQNARRYGREPLGGLLTGPTSSAGSCVSSYEYLPIIMLCLLTICETGCIDNESRHHALAPRAVRPTPCSPASTSTRANQPLPSVSGPRQSWRQPCPSPKANSCP